MNSSESVENSDLTELKGLLPFITRNNPRIDELEQLRLEKRVRILFHDASKKMRGKQWEMALADIDRARKIGIDLFWKEAVACADLLRDKVAVEKSNSIRAASEKNSQERYDKRHLARLQRENAEHDRLAKLRRS